MALFEFELRPVEDIEPWGEPGQMTLSWFALTDGRFWMPVGEQTLFQYSREIGAHWATRQRETDYQIAAFARDFLGCAAAATARLPEAIERIAADWELLSSLDGGRSGASDADYAAWRWVGERSPWTSYLVATPRVSFVRIGDDVRVHWDSRQQEDGIQVWTASKGVFVMRADTFLAECRGFAERLLRSMSARIGDIEAGRVSPQVGVDVRSLREQHESWRVEFESYMQKGYEPDVPWGEAEQALRALAREFGVPLPT